MQHGFQIKYQIGCSAVSNKIPNRDAARFPIKYQIGMVHSFQQNTRAGKGCKKSCHMPRVDSPRHMAALAYGPL